MSGSFLFYDLETWGLDPRKTRIAQFAAIRTTVDLEEIDTPVSLYVRPAADFLPCPESALITGITPQLADAEGLVEAEAFDRIHALMAEPDTCTLGYNTLKFDDAFVRFGLYRNFHDAYEREYRDGNSRWDMFNVIRAVHALRPEGIQWRAREDVPEATSFRLEHLAEDNGLRHGMAHEALSDVRATVGLARLVKTHQPKFWHYLARLRDKRHVQQLINLTELTPLMHIAGQYSPANRNAAIVVPISEHPVNRNQMLFVRVDVPLDDLASADPDLTKTHYFTRRDALPEGVSRPPFTDIRVNESPTLIPLSDLRDADFERTAIDKTVVERNLAYLRKHRNALASLARHVFAPSKASSQNDVDAALFDGFIAPADKALFRQIHACPPDALGAEGFRFQDARMPELFFRYRARNWPEFLSFEEQACWQGHLAACLNNGINAQYSLQAHAEKVEQLRVLNADNPHELGILDAMDAWRHALAQSLGS
ncbi:exodeoxyribonuclease I [Lysobacter sp. HDW10]|uniref:exodeoxyribonuclease I n=1 Tax=Lysobacter sp. HDW10 TaxID=2714936 RepID=UPI00140946F2|nr:exodeoxyribonuclease I [Lysobacter sp. HDW10]QIK81543.1 exodeoxyribonuclease I [Lysobacter sp. HDW10]